MVRTQRARWGIAAVGLIATVLLSARAGAIYLDEAQNVNLRARIYSQMSIRTENSDVDGHPIVKSGQLIQNRNFYNPELDANLTPYTTWMKGSFLDWLAPDDFKFRIAGWGFYDGIYDYGTSQFGNNLVTINPFFRNYNAGICETSRTPCGSTADCPAGDRCVPAGAWFMMGDKITPPPAIGPNGQPIPPDMRFIDNLDQLLPGAELEEPRDVYAHQQRVNELYLSYSKGPFFLRLGRQAISWGEADTIALLDQNNPFDLTLAAPGLFEDLDEARIPLWTIRTSYNVFETLGPFSSGFFEAYWVPGWIDTTTSFLPMLTASPYSPPGKNPQFSNGFPNATYQFILFDQLPEKDFGNSRWGFRFQTVVNRAYTVQGWIYTAFPTAPAPLKAPPVVVRPGTGGSRTPIGSPLFVTQTVHQLTTAYGLASTFFVEQLDGILRLEAEYFENEPGFVPQDNLNIGAPGKSPVNDPGSLPLSDNLRWEVGFDRFFFFRLLNPTNSFVMSASNVGAYNLSETSVKDFRMGVRKLGRDIPNETPVPTDFIDIKTVENFFQITFLTDYMHGRLTPQLTVIQNVRGTNAIHPQLTYRWNDWLLFRLDGVVISGDYQGLGIFRDRNQVALRVTYQLN